MAEAPAVAVRDVEVTLSGTRVLAGVDFEARFGSLLAILGPNGAGKTTLLKALAGLLQHRGRIELDGHDSARMPPRERGRRIAFVPQRSQLVSRLPVYDVVSHGRYAHRGGLSALSSRDRQAIEVAMARADVTHLAARAVPELSHGEQRRVLLARALATQARILLLDEPTASLDIAHALSLFATLRALANDGHCVVLVLHQLDDALRFTDQSLLLHEGRQIACGPTSAVVSPDNVRRVYGVQLVPADALGFRLTGAAP